MDYYEKNIAALAKRDPKLVEMVEQFEYPENLFVSKGNNRKTILARLDDSGNPILLTSPVDPKSEAQTLLGGQSFDDEDGTVLFGFGLGSLASEIAKRKERNHVLFVIEALPGLFKLAMKHADLVDLLEDKRVVFSIGGDKSDVVEKFEVMKNKIVTGHIGKLAMPSLVDLCQTEYEDINTFLERHIWSLQNSLKTFSIMKERCIVNAINNLPSLITSLPFEYLANIYKNKPAVIVGAGPSLGENLAILKRIQTDTLIIAVDTALKPLIDFNICPDLVVTCDPFKLNEKKVEGLNNIVFENLPLVYSTDGVSPLIEQFKGKKFVVSANNSFSRWMMNTVFGKIQTMTYLGVSQLAFGIAKSMKADPIVLVGIDLSFPGDKDHCDGCAKIWSPAFDNSSFFEWIPNNCGGRVKTILGFVSMLQALEADILKTGARCINTSKEGAFIRGAEYMPLDKALKKIDRANSNDAKVIFRCFAGNHESQKQEKYQLKVKENLEWLLRQIEALFKICMRSQSIVKKSKVDNGSKNPDPNDIIQLERLFASAFQHEELLDILTDYLPGYMAACSEGKQEIAGAEHGIQHDVKTMTLFFNELLEVLPLMRKGLREAMNKFQSIQHSSKLL